MTTRKKSSAMQFLDNLTGSPLSVGAILEATRLSEGESQTAFAKKLKISASHLCDIEKGRKSVSPARAAQFAKILGKHEPQFVRLAIQEELNRAGLKYTVSLETA